MDEDAPGIALRRRWALFGFTGIQASFIAIAIIGLEFGHVTLREGRALIDLAVVLIALICAFAVLVIAGRRKRLRPATLATAWPAAIALALSFEASQAALLFAPGSFGLIVIIMRLISGCAIAVLLFLWGRILGRLPIGDSVPTAFIGSALAAALVFLMMALPWPSVTFVLGALPLVSAFALGRIDADFDATGVSAEALALVKRPLDQTPERAERGLQASFANVRRLNARIYAGTAIFGLAIGLVETFATMTANARVNIELMLLLFILFALAALQLFRGAGWPLERLRDVRLIGAHVERGPLDGAYRLAFLLIMTGFLLMPLAPVIGAPTATIVMTGSIAVLVVFMSLFLVMGQISATDAGLYFGRGLLGFCAGELVGIVVSLFAELASYSAPFDEIALVCAAFAVLLDYVFIFTDREMAELSLVVRDVDRFEQSCEDLGRRFKLTPRERDVVGLALRGRSSERIAQELMITKNTVDTHLRRVYRKCGVHGRQELIDVVDGIERARRS